MSAFASFDPDKFVGRTSAPPPPVERPAEPALPREWLHAIDLLRDASRPRFAAPERWSQLMRDAILFAETRGPEAIAAGWSLGNLFGFDPDQRDDLVGLAVDIRGDRVLRVDPDVAWIKHATGCRFHYRRMPDNSPLLWQLSRMGKAPNR